MVAKSPFGDYWNFYEHLQPPGGRHRIGPDLRRCLRGRLGQSIDQATTGGGANVAEWPVASTGG